MCLTAVSHWDQHGAANWSVLSVAADPCPFPPAPFHRTVWLTGNIGLLLFPRTGHTQGWIGCNLLSSRWRNKGWIKSREAWRGDCRGVWIKEGTDAGWRVERVNSWGQTLISKEWRLHRSPLKEADFCAPNVCACAYLRSLWYLYALCITGGMSRFPPQVKKTAAQDLM